MADDWKIQSVSKTDGIGDRILKATASTEWNMAPGQGGNDLDHLYYCPSDMVLTVEQCVYTVHRDGTITVRGCFGNPTTTGTLNAWFYTGLPIPMLSQVFYSCTAIYDRVGDALPVAVYPNSASRAAYLIAMTNMDNATWFSDLLFTSALAPSLTYTYTYKAFDVST